MNQQEAKNICLEVWEYLAKNPNKDKTGLPEALREQIAPLPNQCPLCAVFFGPISNDEIGGCKGCPLYEAGEQCDSRDCEDFHKMDPYSRWGKALEEFHDDPEEFESERSRAAWDIVRIVEDWEI
jgi:hypothetical protein